jgi:hypothetical protein
VAGEAFRNIAERFGTSVTALHRHKQDHLPVHLTQAHEAHEVAQADGLLAQLQALTQETRAILQEVRHGKGKDHAVALKAIGRLEKQLELHARLLGPLQAGLTVNVVTSPAWLALRTTLLTALAPYPDAKDAVAAAILGEHAYGYHSNGTGH